MTKIDPKFVPQKVLRNGDLMPMVGMGTFGSDRFTSEQISAAVKGAIECGYRLFDGASVYGNEVEIGKVYREAFDEDIVRREELFITSKVWNDKHDDVVVECMKTLRDLQLNYLDCYFVHWPFPNYHAPGCDGDARNPDSIPFDPAKFIKTWRQMETLYKMGVVRHLGMSNMTIPKLEAVLPQCHIMPSMIEMELHPSFQQKEIRAYCEARGIAVIGFCPIGSPTRPDRDKSPDDVVDMQMPSVVAAAEAHGVHPAVICLKWAYKNGHTPIPFSIYPEEYASNLKAAIEDPLTDAEYKAICDADANSRFIKGQVFLWEGANDWQDLWDLDGTITK